VTGTTGPAGKVAGTSAAAPVPMAGPTDRPDAAQVVLTAPAPAGPDPRETPAGLSAGPTPGVARVARGRLRGRAAPMPVLRVGRGAMAGLRARAADLLGRVGAQPGPGPVLALRPAPLPSV